MTLRQHLNRCIKFYLQRECHEISFICCFDVTAENLIWPVVFLFFCSWWPAEEQYSSAALQTFLFQCYSYFDILDIQLDAYDFQSLKKWYRESHPKEDADLLNKRFMFSHNFQLVVTIIYTRILKHTNINIQQSHFKNNAEKRFSFSYIYWSKIYLKT